MMTMQHSLLLRFFWPLLSVFLQASYLHFVHCILMWKWAPYWSLLVWFIPLFLMELRFSQTFEPHTSHEHELRALKARLSFWLFAFSVWCVLLPGVSLHFRPFTWLQAFGPHVYTNLLLVHGAQPHMSAWAGIYWLAAYLKWTAFTGRKRVFTGIGTPVLLTILLFINFYYYGNLYLEQTPSDVLSQPGVSLRYTPEMAQQAGVEVINSPRGLHYDSEQNAIFAAYGSTYLFSDDWYPTIVRYDLQTHKAHFFESRNVRRLSMETDHIYVAPWNFEAHKGIYVLSKTDLSLQNNIPFQKDSATTFEAFDTFVDSTRNRLYVTTNGYPQLLAYELPTGKLVASLNLHEMGLVHTGGFVWGIRQANDGKLYFMGGNGHSLFEVDPDILKLNQSIRLPFLWGTELAISEERNTLYVQNGFTSALYEFDRSTFEVLRVLEGEIHSKRMHVDPQRDLLYVLSYTQGTLFAINLKTGVREWTLHVGKKPHGLQFDQDQLWVHSMLGVLQVDLER